MQRHDIDELPLVMAEIAAAMSARGTALTIHPDDTGKPHVLHVDTTARIDIDDLERLLTSQIRWDLGIPENHCSWIACDVDESCQDLLIVPVARINGHSQLIISIFFDHLDSDKKAAAEAVYTQRAPFAVGYFRLWQLNRTREKALAAAKAALNMTSMAIMLLDRLGRIIFTNSAAEAMLAEGDGLRRVGQSIRAVKLSDSIRLQVAIEHMIEVNGTGFLKAALDRHGAIFALERKSSAPLMVSILPTEDSAEEPQDVAVIVYVVDPASEVSDLLRPVCKVYGLSPVETQLTCNLIAGHTLSEAAALMHIKDMTARSYLKQIFLKTDTHRQTTLVQLMLSSIIRTSTDIVAMAL